MDGYPGVKEVHVIGRVYTISPRSFIPCVILGDIYVQQGSSKIVNLKNSVNVVFGGSLEA